MAVTSSRLNQNPQIVERTKTLAFQQNRGRNTLLTLGAGLVVILLLWFLTGLGSAKLSQALALFAIWGVATVSLNLINGTLGILSLGHHGFMLIGGYTTALLILPDDARQRILDSGRSAMTETTVGLSVSNLFSSIGLGALTGDETLWLRFLVAIFIGGIVAALAGLIVGIPSLRLRGDYLAIVTFGFGEIIRLSASTRIFAPLTNGALGFAGVPSEFGKSVWWTFGFLAFTLFVISKLKYSSYGRAMESIREDEIASEAMGVNLAYHKVLGFVISAFFAGIAGGLWVSWLGNARLDNFLFTLTFFFLVAISAGGTGSITGVLIGTALVIFVRQYGDPLEESYAISSWLEFVGIILIIAGAAFLLYRSFDRSGKRLPNWSVWLFSASLFILLLGSAVFPGINLGKIGLYLVLVPFIILPFLPNVGDKTKTVGWGVYALLGAGVLALIVGGISPGLGWFTDTFRGFGMRGIALAILLIVIMIFRPSGIVGRKEFSWGWLFREKLDEPTEEERKQDAWLSNPELNRAGGAANLEGSSEEDA